MTNKWYTTDSRLFRMPHYSTADPTFIAALKELEEGSFCFVVADKKQALFLLFNKGEVIKDEEFMHPGIKKKIRTDSGELSGRNDKLMRHIDQQVKDHFRLIGERVGAFTKDCRINGVFIGGHREMFHLMIGQLPTDIQQKMKGEFATELTIPKAKLIARCKEELERYVKGILG